jgi:hypothetical protein
MQIFEHSTGKFMPLSDEQLASLTETQAAAYTEVADVVHALAAAEAEAETATVQVNSDLAVLKDAEKNAPKFDADAERVKLTKEMIASNRIE